MGAGPTRRAQRYRRYRIRGLLPGLVMVGGGFYLGLAQQKWLVLVAGAVFLLLCAAMIATDRPAARRTTSVTGLQSPPWGERRVPTATAPAARRLSYTAAAAAQARIDRRTEIIAHTLARVGQIGPFAHCTTCSRDTAPRTLDSPGVLVRGRR
jgi:hypothetical protein